MKYKGVKLVPKPWYWRLFPTLNWCNASAGFEKIYLKQDIYDDIKQGRLNPLVVALLEHELIHIKRQRQIGRWKFSFLYKLSPKFRIKEELIADKARFSYIKKHRLKYDLVARAKMLSSWKYYWAISYQEAKEKLEELYKRS